MFRSIFSLLTCLLFCELGVVLIVLGFFAEAEYLIVTKQASDVANYALIQTVWTALVIRLAIML